ncbi:hypothetical protein NAPIS_ORF02554 [Vairimorpha apis BRL 01]|uniref:Uncharacterized protein n=1 Tax=Vairimorpha apis BRL 01 TaxID=1037528 RepID=T0KWK4_9MICR|nr:hypothetical protein NAPIS_ORF02554 [Vairimorpha apis BRL 01]
MALEKIDKPWKKSEDEILKMSIMKYGLNKWSKIATILKRTAMECKSRYYDFLCKNSIWTDEDISKLLEISKHLKPQWKLIGEILNKCEQDCYEKYLNLVYKDLDTFKYNELKDSIDDNDYALLDCAVNRIKK